MPTDALILSRAGSTFADRWLFRLVCAFWLSQAWLIPLAAIGPWPAWPTWADFIIVAMLPFVLLSGRGLGRARQIVWFAIFGVAICTLSFAWATTIYGMNNPGAPFGIALLCRLAEYTVALIATAKISLSVERIRTLSRVSLIAFLAIVAGVLITAASPLFEAVAAIGLPPDLDGSGPWAGYITGQIEDGVGFVSHNHGYTSVQLILALGLALSLNKFSDRFRVLLYSAALAAAFFTRSRDGFLCMLWFIVISEFKRSKAVLVCLGVIALIAGSYFLRNDSLAEVVERQQSISSALSENGISGRTEIWKEHRAYFEQHPFTLLTGVGFGYSVAKTGDNAHMLYLHILTEVGALGLMAFLLFHWWLLQRLKVSRPMYWTVVVLLLTGLTQETLWPVLIFTHFVGFYLSAVVAVIRVRSARIITLRVDHGDGSTFPHH